MKYLYLVWKNLGRRKLRTVLTVFSTIVAFVLFGLLAAVRLGFSAGVEVSGVDRMLVTHKTVKAGDKVLVLGASGGVGTGCVILARMLGAEVIAAASSADKIRRLRELGANEVIVVRIAVGLKPAVKAHGRRQDLEQKVTVLGRLEDTPDGARQDRRLHRRGEGGAPRDLVVDEERRGWPGRHVHILWRRTMFSSAAA